MRRRGAAEANHGRRGKGYVRVAGAGSTAHLPNPPRPISLLTSYLSVMGCELYSVAVQFALERQRRFGTSLGFGTGAFDAALFTVVASNVTPCTGALLAQIPPIQPAAQTQTFGSSSARCTQAAAAPFLFC